jgi:hypothetical protein
MMVAAMPLLFVNGVVVAQPTDTLGRKAGHQSRGGRKATRPDGRAMTASERKAAQRQRQREARQSAVIDTSPTE